MILLGFTWFFLPETKDRTLEEIHEMFEARLPARAFRTYVCTGVEGFAAEAFGDNPVKTSHAGGALHIEKLEKEVSSHQVAQV